MTRRSFLTGTSASVAAFAFLSSGAVKGAESNSKIRVGLIGCGGRGQWIANLFQQHGGYQMTAVADYFEDRVRAAGEKWGVSGENRFSGLNGYKRMLEGNRVDAVIIQSPPYFHPAQAADAVAAGKHVFLAKPVAVDVPGCQSIAESGQQATRKKLCFLVDFQTRANPAYQEAVGKVHSGTLGKVVLVEAAYHCSLMFEGIDREVRQNPGNPEVRLRAWAVDRALSGDIITEQNIHALDVASWMLNADPMKAAGAGGRKRDFVGNCWDHFAVVYQFPGDIVLSFNSHQAGFASDDILCRLHGTDGTVETHYAGKVVVRAREFRSDNGSGNLYHDGAVANIATFHRNIAAGDASNPTVAASVRSNLTTILGRTAAYRGREVTWQEMMASGEKLEADLKGLKA